MARDRRVQAVGAAAVLAGLFGTLTVALPGERRLHLGGGFARDQVTAYGPAHAALALSPVLTGLGLALARRPVQIVAATGVAGFLSAQLAGVGCVATRRWPLYWGCCAVRGVEHESLMTRLALLMGLGCAAVAVSCLLLLVQEGLLEWQRGTAVLAPAVALGVLEAIPWIMATSTPYVSGDVSDLGAAFLTYSGPFAAALVVSAFMSRGPALVVIGAVVASAVIGTAGRPFLDTVLPYQHARWFAVGAAVTVGVVRFLAPRPRPAARDSLA
jgi:hypothetical protein